MRKTIAAGSIAGALAVIAAAGAMLLGTGAVNAADPTASPTPAATAAPTTGGTPNADHQACDRGGPGGDILGPNHELVTDTSVAAKAIGITESELTTALSSGKSMADVAKANNVDPQKVIDALVADQESEIAAALKAGTITQAQADAEKAAVPARIADQVNRTEGTTR